MSCWIFAAYGLAALFFIFLLQAALPVRSRFAWMSESDSDMKLAPFPGTKASAKDALEPSSEEIELYFKHKRCHNLDHARQLGTNLGEHPLAVLRLWRHLFNRQGTFPRADAVSVCH